MADRQRTLSRHAGTEDEPKNRQGAVAYASGVVECQHSESRCGPIRCRIEAVASAPASAADPSRHVSYIMGALPAQMPHEHWVRGAAAIRAVTPGRTNHRRDGRLALPWVAT